MSDYLWGVATPLLLAYLGFGIYVMVEDWAARPSPSLRSQHMSPFVKPPLITRSWPAFLALWLPMPVLWPLSVAVGRVINSRWREAHNAGARAHAAQRLNSA
ncbi:MULTISPECIES: hypothetical protein [Mycolicibacter]|uniref:Uncharacterized protein n=2 Tax=Mycolicibacter TaxID=1073531 RepID=A0ABU5XN10_9MYCO|nr:MULTISPECIES: hypothetical protein [unclassified Mycolicibacter]MEB3023369.1 hypothetical protein [Mycolicibacter sp. MYC098]MEB3033711.1 hypothetical protein [Mycolicibacter sp. MYC340]